MSATASARDATRPAREPLKFDWAKVTEMRVRDLTIRFGFGFAISVLAGIIVKLAGPRFGGMFLAFPAILPATTTLLQRRNGLAQAAADVRGATAGAVGMIAFAVVARLLLGRTSPTLALAGAVATWLVACAAIYGIMRAVVHLLGEYSDLPEIPTAEGAVVLSALRRASLTIGTAESCTGGLVSSMFTSVPDASEIFRGSIVAYDNEVKIQTLCVDPDVINNEGSVSAAVATSMSRNVRAVLGCDVGLAITGVTGAPAEGKPAGLTFIAVTLPGGCTLVRRYTDDFGPGRNDERAIRMAFKAIRDALAGETDDDHNVTQTSGGRP